jgi:farnesol dehydrogenase
LERDSLHAAAEGCEAILHAAGLSKMWVRDRRQFDRVNVQGFGHVVEAARATRARLIRISSFVALGPTDGAVFDERTPRATMEFRSDYERTHWVADQMARHLGRDGFPIVRLYPGPVFGPGSLTDGNRVVTLLLQHARGQLRRPPGAEDRRHCFSYVDDVTEGALRAVESAPPDSAYILGGENRTLMELFHAFGTATGVTPPRRRRRFFAGLFSRRAQRWRAHLSGIEPERPSELIGFYRHDWAYSSGRAENDLGYRITPFEDAVSRTAEWLREAGEL